MPIFVLKRPYKESKNQCHNLPGAAAACPVLDQVVPDRVADRTCRQDVFIEAYSDYVFSQDDS